MDEEEPAWRAELRAAIHRWDEWGVEVPLRMAGGLLDTLIPHIQAAEQRGRDESSRRWEGVLKADWARYRGNVLDEVWKAMRDAEGGPLLDAMRVVNKLLEQP